MPTEPLSDANKIRAERKPMNETIYLIPSGAGKAHISAPGSRVALCGQITFQMDRTTLRPADSKLCKRCAKRNDKT